MTPTDAEARALLDAEAAASHARVLWWGRPSASRVALRALPASFFGLFFGGFAVFWMFAAAGGLSRAPRPEGPLLLFPLFGLPFLLIGLGMLLAPLLTAAGARRTLYAVTDRGILVVRAGRGRRVESHPLPREGELRRSARADGTGDLFVGATVTDPARLGARPITRQIVFVGIPDVVRVERIVADAVLAASHGSAGIAVSSAPPGPLAPVGPTAVPAGFDAARPYYRVEPRPFPGPLLLAIGFALGFALAWWLARTGRLAL